MAYPVENTGLVVAALASQGLDPQRREGGKLHGVDTCLSCRLGLRTFSEEESRTVPNTPGTPSTCRRCRPRPSWTR